jgi:hypothetical protein
MKVMSRLKRALLALLVLPWALLGVLLTVDGLTQGIWILPAMLAVLTFVLLRATVLLFGPEPPLRRARRAPIIDPLPRLLRQLPRVTIRDAAEGKQVLIVGKARPRDKPLTAPLSHRPACFYDARVYGERGAPVARETGGCDFFVEDDTGRALIRVKSARPIVKLDAVYRSYDQWATSRQLALLRRHNRQPRGLLLYREGAITPGEHVAVIGSASREPDPEGGASYREMPTRLVFDGEIVCVTDLV